MLWRFFKHAVKFTEIVLVVVVLFVGLDWLNALWR